MRNIVSCAADRHRHPGRAVAANSAGPSCWVVTRVLFRSAVVLEKEVSANFSRLTRLEITKVERSVTAHGRTGSKAAGESVDVDE